MKNDVKYEFNMTHSMTSEVFGQKIKPIHTCGGAPEQFEEFSYFALPPPRDTFTSFVFQQNFKRVSPFV